MATVTVDFNANLARFSSAIDKATADLNKFQTNADRMAKNVKGAFGGLAVGFSVAAFTAYGKAVMDTADRLQDLSDRTSVSVKDLASLDLAAKLADTSIDDVGKAIARLNLSFSQAQGGSKEIGAALRRLGVTSDDAKERFFQMADAYERAGGQGRVLDDIQKVLGKSYLELIPLLKQGGDELRRAAQESESFADAVARLSPEAGKFNDQLDLLKQNVAGLTAAGLADIIPTINDIASAMRTAYEESGFFKAAIVGLGGIGTAILTDEFKSDLAKLEKLKKQLADIEELPIPGLVASEAKRAEMRAEIARLEASVTSASAAALKAAEEKAKKAAQLGGTPPTHTPQTAAKADPLKPYLDATDIEKTREYNRLLDLLNQRFDNGRKNAELYSQALAGLNSKFGVNQPLIDALGTGSYFARDKETADWLKQSQEDYNSLNAMIPESTQRLQEMIAAADFSKIIRDQQDMVILTDAFNQGLLTEEQYLDAVRNRLGLVGEAANQSVPIFQQLGMVIVNNLGGAISSGKSFSDVLDVLGKQLENMIFQLTVVEPLTKGIKGMLEGGGSSGGGNFISDIIGWLFSANGNAFSGGSVQAFANGGVLGPLGGLLTRPTVFPMANGGIGIGGEAGTEAVMPLQRMKNGKLGVYAANDGASQQMIVNIIESPGNGGKTQERTDQNGTRVLDVFIEQFRGSIASDINSGRGPVSTAIERTYGLNRTAGAY